MRHRSLSRTIGKLALAGMLIVGSLARVYAGSSSDAPTAGPRLLDSSDHVHVIGVMQSGPDAVVITLRIDPGFHINANPASEPYLIPTTLSFAGVRPLQIRYPRAVQFKPTFADGPIEVYEGTITIRASFPQGTLMSGPPPRATLTVQACTETICLRPADLPVPG